MAGRRRRPPLGRLRFSRRWEVGLPLMTIGAAVAGLTVGVRGAGVLFWIGAGLAAIGTGVFFSAPPRA